MSISAIMFVLFRNPPAAFRLQEIEERVSNRTGFPVADSNDRYDKLWPLDEADLVADVGQDGVLHYRDPPRYARLPDVPPLEGRMYKISFSSRYWDRDISDGPAMRYALTILTLLAQHDVEGVWYCSHYYQDGADIAPSTTQSALQMVMDFVAVGMTSNGRPVRYIRTDVGVIDI
ncbi:hypothetical protein [Burkholderia sp. Ac-20365]|uniref:hypothetical protein n=1 Tax=Burkholderia sp. Ac-20365 TaxID=2703897 RepID=UPI00197BF1C7|nr:hypothetical protein [Burkholderia sp. Ac-20365]MBN3761196.1 hypothetical protein [Burkholderia sp. Ac-20365]